MSALTMNSLAYAVVLGAAFGVGVCLLVSLTPRWGAPSLSRRLAPYLRDIADPLGITPLAAPEFTRVDALWTRARDALGRIAGGDASIARRLRQAGRPIDTGAFRGRQLVWAIAGLIAGAAFVVVLIVTGRSNPALWVVPLLGAAAGFFGCDTMLARAARARTARIEEELPTVLEFLALCLSAGEGLLDSLRRVSRIGSGELTGEVRAAVVAVGTGSSLSDSLSALSQGLAVPAVSRTIDQLVAAIDRGAPLAQVLHAQALDAREEAKRGLIERAGRNEIYMLVPLVLVILPLSVLFAVFPGIFMLRLGIS